MAQPSVAQYFNTRKRPAVDYKVDRARKVLILDQEKKGLNRGSSQNIERCVTPPPATSHKQQKTEVASELTQIKKKICRSAKLNELKASINSFKESADRLKAVEKRTAEISHSPKLKTFRSLEFEVTLSPQKTQSPEKPYLSPRKESCVRRNLLGALSPTKTSVSAKSDSNLHDVADGSTTSNLQLPFKYRTFNEVFRAIDTIAQILYNRKELITFNKLKPAVEEMIKRNFLQRHLSQIKYVYPEAYNYTQEKVKIFGIGSRQEQWDLVVTPNIENRDGMTSHILLTRRRKLHERLVNKIKDYHNEFLLALTPPMIIAKENITRWHPEFDLEKVPDIELSDLPQPPSEEKYTTGKEVLEKARQMFNCNTRMEQALSKLKQIHERIPTREQQTTTQLPSVIKGIPKALLEKVRQKQAAKALLTMTRTEDKEKELQLYSRLPEIARLTRNLFVTEKKGVLELDIVVGKLGNSYRCFLNTFEIEEHLKAISREVPDWLVFHKLRNSVFIKLAKNADLSIVINKLEKIAKQKSEC